MNIAFNQNCQLIISEIPEKGGYKYVLEVIEKVSDNTIQEVFINRNESAAIDIVDGLYKYKKLLTDNEEFITTLDLSKVNNPGHSIGDWEETNIFSICNLRKCAFEQEKQAITEFLSTCNKKNCNKKSTQQSTRDILLISLFVLEHLICEGKYNEAQKIIDQLDSCRDLCGNRTLKSCCCNG